MLNQIDLSQVEATVVDGFVYLNDEQKYGLGGYLYEKLNERIPIIGVAKTNFASIEKNKKALLEVTVKNRCTLLQSELIWTKLLKKSKVCMENLECRLY